MHISTAHQIKDAEFIKEVSNFSMPELSEWIAESDKQDAGILTNHFYLWRNKTFFDQKVKEYDQWFDEHPVWFQSEVGALAKAIPKKDLDFQ